MAAILWLAAFGFALDQVPSVTVKVLKHCYNAIVLLAGFLEERLGAGIRNDLAQNLLFQGKGILDRRSDLQLTVAVGRQQHAQAADQMQHLAETQLPNVCRPTAESPAAVQIQACRRRTKSPCHIHPQELK